MNAQFDSVTTASTSPLVANTVPLLADGCVVSNRFTSPPDGSTGVTAGTVGIVEGSDNTVKRHGFRVASNDGKYYPVTEAPNGEYTLATFNTAVSNGWSTAFYYNGFGATWTIVSEDRRDFANTDWVGAHDAPLPRGAYVEYQITGGPGYRHGVAVRWTPAAGGHMPHTDIKVLPPNHGGGTVYHSMTSWRDIPDATGGPLPVIDFMANDASGTPIDITNIKVIIF